MSSYKPKNLIIPVIIVAALVGVLALGAYFFTDGNEQTADISDKLVYDAALADPINDEDWVKGPDKPRVTIVTFSDFQCPACAYAHENIVEVLAEKHPDDVRVVFRHFPISSHKQAQLAAEATEAAGAQGKFWEMTSLVFQNQSELDRDKLIKLATQLGLDVSRFTAELDSGMYQQAVMDDRDSGDRSGVSATPTFYINGEKYEGKIKPEDVISEVEKHLP